MALKGSAPSPWRLRFVGFLKRPELAKFLINPLVNPQSTHGLQELAAIPETYCKHFDAPHLNLKAG